MGFYLHSHPSETPTARHGPRVGTGPETAPRLAPTRSPSAGFLSPRTATSSVPTIETNGVETHYERRGDGPPVVFVHGLGFDGRSWAPQLAALEEEYDVVAYDYRGHGETAGGVSVRSIEQLAADLHGLVEGLDLDRPVLCAHSYGGLIVAEYAVQHPDDLRGIAFADARTDFGETTAERVLLRLRPLLDRVEGVVGEDRYRRAIEFVARRVQGMEKGRDDEVPELGMTPSAYAAEAGESFADDAADAYMDAARAYVGASPTDFHVPVLYAYGELTSDVISDKAERLERAPTDVRVREIEGVSHGVMLERPDTFTETLREFLAEVTAESGTRESVGDAGD